MPPDQLEIRIDRREIDAYRVEMRFSSTTSETDALAIGRALPPIDVDGELARIEAHLDGIPVTKLAGPGAATLEDLRAHLREEHDILYLVCHGALLDGVPHLWLEKENGESDVVKGADL